MLKPLSNRVVIKPQVRQISALLHVANLEPFNEGTIIAVGPKVNAVKPGDFVKYGNGDYLNWPTHRIDGQDYQIIQEADICAVVEQ